MEITLFDSYTDFDAAPSGSVTVDLPADAGDASDYFALKMADDSMAPVYAKGQVVVFKKQRKAPRETTVFAAVGKDLYVRKMSYDKDFLSLIPENSAYEKLDFTGFSLNRVKVKGVAVKALD